MAGKLPVYALPRSGSNLLMAWLHTIPSIFSAAHGLTKSMSRQSWPGAVGVPAHDRSIYPQCHPPKDDSRVRWVAFDKVNPRECAAAGPGLVLAREPYGILWSRHQYHQKHRREMWALTGKNVVRFVRAEWEPLKAAMSCNPVIWLEELVRVDWLRFNYTVSGCCNAPLVVRDTTEGAGADFSNNTLKPRPHWHCTGCQRPMIGYGGFNPYDTIDADRVEQWRHEMPEHLFDMIKERLG